MKKGFKSCVNGCCAQKSTGTEGEGETATAAVTLPPRSALKLQRNVAKEGSTKVRCYLCVLLKAF